MLLASELSRDDSLLIIVEINLRCRFVDDDVWLRRIGFATSIFTTSTSHGESSFGKNGPAPR
jgi:hypothetical protein